eukprot:GDKJ01026153.1.p1 GENE.GDKJ01026153.1~~GDKJ01026153.1.p1  ORF type:complete len:503 (-),score=123.73 GDKJ01026153.1:424-1782(-)
MNSPVLPPPPPIRKRPNNLPPPRVSPISNHQYPTDTGAVPFLLQVVFYPPRTPPSITFLLRTLHNALYTTIPPTEAPLMLHEDYPPPPLHMPSGGARNLKSLLRFQGSSNANRGAVLSGAGIATVGVGQVQLHHAFQNHHVSPAGYFPLPQTAVNAAPSSISLQQPLPHQLPMHQYLSSQQGVNQPVSTGGGYLPPTLVNAVSSLGRNQDASALPSSGHQKFHDLLAPLQTTSQFHPSSLHMRGMRTLPSSRVEDRIAERSASRLFSISARTLSWWIVCLLLIPPILVLAVSRLAPTEYGVNGVAFRHPPSSPLAIAPYLSVQPVVGEVVEFSLLGGGAKGDIHPFHVHGSHGQWMGETDEMIGMFEGEFADVFNPQLRVHMSNIPSKTEFSSWTLSQKLSWTRKYSSSKIRVRFLHAGIHPVHCHIGTHEDLGMMALMKVKVDDSRNEDDD